MIPVRLHSAVSRPSSLQIRSSQPAFSGRDRYRFDETQPVQPTARPRFVTTALKLILAAGVLAAAGSRLSPLLDSFVHRHQDFFTRISQVPTRQSQPENAPKPEKPLKPLGTIQPEVERYTPKP